MGDRRQQIEEDDDEEEEEEEEDILYFSYGTKQQNPTLTPSLTLTLT